MVGADLMNTSSAFASFRNVRSGERSSGLCGVTSISMKFTKGWVYSGKSSKDVYVPEWNAVPSHWNCERDGHVPEMCEITSGIWGYLHFSMVISYQIRTYLKNLWSLVYISLWLLFDISNTSCEFTVLYLVCFACLIFFASMFFSCQKYGINTSATVHFLEILVIRHFVNHWYLFHFLHERMYTIIWHLFPNYRQPCVVQSCICRLWECKALELCFPEVTQGDRGMYCFYGLFGRRKTLEVKSFKLHMIDVCCHISDIDSRLLLKHEQCFWKGLDKCFSKFVYDKTYYCSYHTNSWTDWSEKKGTTSNRRWANCVNPY